MKWKLLAFVLLSNFASTYVLQAQVLEAAYCEWDDIFDEWKLHINEDEFIMVTRQFGANPYRRWNFDYEDMEGNRTNGFMQLKWANDLNYWDVQLNNERLNITTIYRDDYFGWKVEYGDATFSIIAKDRFGFAWEQRNARNFEWKMFQKTEGDFRDWYIDDFSGDQLTFEMRIAAAMIIIEVASFGVR